MLRENTQDAHPDDMDTDQHRWRNKSRVSQQMGRKRTDMLRHREELAAAPPPETQKILFSLAVTEGFGVRGDKQD